MDKSKFMVLMNCIYHFKEVKPEYRKHGDNRIITCCRLPDGIKNVCYSKVRPDGTIISCTDEYHSEKYIKKHGLAIEWDHLKVDYWAWVTDIIPI